MTCEKMDESKTFRITFIFGIFCVFFLFFVFLNDMLHIFTHHVLRDYRLQESDRVYGNFSLMMMYLFFFCCEFSVYTLKCHGNEEDFNAATNLNTYLHFRFA